jgi:glycogen debranching enzyme
VGSGVEWQLDQTDATYRGAVEALKRCCNPCGLKASGRPRGHDQVWARDSMIAALGARLVPDEEIQSAIRASLFLLRDQRSSTGAIPNNVNCATGRPNFRAYADGGLWWVVGNTMLAPDPETVREVLHWYEYQDVDQSGLLSMQESSDWQDLFCTRGQGLYLNCLYVLALRAAAKLFGAGEGERYLRRAAATAERINTRLWYAADGNLLRHISHQFSTEGLLQQDSLGRQRWQPEKRYLTNEQYYLPYLGFREVGEWFDSLGNLLAILAGVADAQQSGIILDLIARHALDTWPLRSLTPVVQPGDRDWRDYYATLNVPYHYHNGGVWPFIGGFYVAALTKAGRHDAAAKALRDLALLNQRGQFNEWHHGETGEPMGVQDQAWSAGMYLFACYCVRRGRVELF